jgi:hypothetical protein
VMVLSFDLQGFILRARVLKLYRQALRTAWRAPAHAKGEILRLEKIVCLNNYNNISRGNYSGV